MKWGAHKADVRIATTNARKIQAALRQGIDAKRVIAAYRKSQPNATKNPAADRARARAWAMLNMRINNEPLLEVLQKTWADGFVLGEAYGNEAIARAREAKKAASDYIDWDNWRPGDAATATLLRPPKAFQELLGRARVTIKDLDQTGYDRVGTALADSIEQGLSDTRAARLINDAIGNPARALSIAITETNRAMSYGAITRYQTAKLEQMEWETSDPCPACAMNSNVVVNIGSTFPSGATMPPAHPHCRCALLPVIPEFEPNANGVVDIAPAEPFKPIELTDERALNFARKAKETSGLPKGSDPNLHAAQELMDYNGKPTILSADDFDKVEGVKVYRGVERKSHVDAFLDGDNYAGQGVYGNGSYSTTNQKYALQFAENNLDNVMELKITPDFNTVTVQEMNIWRNTFEKEIEYKINQLQWARKEAFDLQDYKSAVAKIDAQLEEMYLIKQRLGHDLGTLATLRGYDAIVVNAGEMGLTAVNDYDELYYVILNRSKLIAKGKP